MTTDDKVIRFANVSQELGARRLKEAQCEAGTVLIVGHGAVGEALHLLRDAGFTIENSTELNGFVCTKPGRRTKRI